MDDFKAYIRFLEKELIEFKRNNPKNLRIAAMKQRAIEVCNRQLTFSESFIYKLTKDGNDLQWEVSRLSSKVTDLEAIALIHGINDFPMWMNKGSGYLMNEVIHLHKINQRQTPALLQQNGTHS
jgi:hypothetical protein